MRLAIVLGALVASACGPEYPPTGYQFRSSHGLHVYVPEGRHESPAPFEAQVSTTLLAFKWFLGWEDFSALDGFRVYVREPDEPRSENLYWSTWHGQRIGGFTHCSAGFLELAKTDWSTWRRTALAHELAHVLQGCRSDLEPVEGDLDQDHRGWGPPSGTVPGTINHAINEANREPLLVPGDL